MVTPEGVAVGLLHTGSSYADDLAEGGVIYHYPQTVGLHLPPHCQTKSA
jgi:hypothetical protein